MSVLTVDGEGAARYIKTTNNKNANTPIRKAYRSDAEAFVYQQDFGDARFVSSDADGGIRGY